MISKVLTLSLVCAVGLLLTGCNGGGSASSGEFASIETCDITTTPSDIVQGPDVQSNVVNPEPSSLLLLGSGLMGMALLKRRKSS